MIFRQHHLVIEGSFSFRKEHDRFMSKDARPPDKNKEPKSFIDIGKSNVREMAFVTTPMTLI